MDFNFEEQDKKCLRLFLEKVTEMNKTSFVRNLLKISTTFNFNQGKGLEISSQLPDEETLKSFLLTFRHFYLNNSQINFGKICNLLYQKIDNDEIKDNIAKAREVYNKLLNASPIGFKFNNEELTPKKIIDLWLNAEYFHTNGVKREVLKQINATVGPFFQFLFISPLYDLVGIINYLANFIRKEIM